MLSYELSNFIIRDSGGHHVPDHSGGHYVPKNVDFADIFVPLGNFFTKILNIQVALFGYQFKLLHFVLFALIMVAIKIIWNYITRAI